MRQMLRTRRFKAEAALLPIPLLLNCSVNAAQNAFVLNQSDVPTAMLWAWGCMCGSVFLDTALPVTEQISQWVVFYLGVSRSLCSELYTICRLDSCSLFVDMRDSPHGV